MRMFNACPACHRHYDVSVFPAGARLRCSCGSYFQVEFKQPHAPRALKCSHCGGLLEDQARKCNYCSAEITIEERRLDSICPECSARMASDARYCMECGIEIRPQAVQGLPEQAECPRCQSDLRTRSVDKVDLIECGSCAGLWLGHETFKQLCQRTDEGKLVSRSMPAAQVQRLQVDERVMYLPCPICKTLMNRKNYSHTSGVIIDLCREHGVWLDHAELEKIMRFIESGGLDLARRREVERLEEAKRRAESPTFAPFPQSDDVLRRRVRSSSLSGALGVVGDLLGGLFS